MTDTTVKSDSPVNPATPATPATPVNSSDTASYYQHHVFFCLNQRDDGRECCHAKGAQAAQEHAKKRIKQLDMNGCGKVRINKAGCLDRCDLGPVLVVYPEAVWYTYVDNEDIDDIIDSHLVGGKVVERLKI